MTAVFLRPGSATPNRLCSPGSASPERCQAESIPSQLVDLPLIRPIPGLCDQFGSHGILANVLPLLFITFGRSQDVVKVAFLPERRTSRVSAARVFRRPLFPLAHKCLHWVAIAKWRAEEMCVVWHQDVSSYSPTVEALCMAPHFPTDLMHCVTCEHRTAVRRACRDEKDRRLNQYLIEAREVLARRHWSVSASIGWSDC